jgi:proline iminopeptidase
MLSALPAPVVHGTEYIGMTPSPIPEPRAQGFTTTTPVPLYWRADGPTCAPPLPTTRAALTLLHGGPGAQHDYLYPQCLALAERQAVVTYDQRGGGQSKADDRTPITWRTQVDDLAKVVTELDLAPPTLVGYSWGALLAMLYAIEATNAAPRAAMPRPERLVLISPAPITREWRNLFEQELAARGRGPVIEAMRLELNDSDLRQRDYEAYRQRAFEVSVAGYFADPVRAASLTPFRVLGRVQQSIWESLGDYDLREALRAVQMPVLVVHGRQDPIPLASAEAAAAALGGDMVVLDDCGHVPYVEQPARLFASIEEFLTK